MNFKIFGPYEIPRENGIICRTSRKVFWQQVEEREKDTRISSACGCYLFAIKIGNCWTPWYVGRTDKQSFAKECLAHHNCTTYNETITARKGIPQLFLLARMTPRGRFKAPAPGRKSKDISFLETLLIATAINKNPDLKNTKERIRKRSKKTS